MPINENDTIETIDLTEPDQVDVAPVIEALPDEPGAGEDFDIEEPQPSEEIEEESQEEPAAEPEDNGGEPAEQPEPEPENPGGERLDNIERRIDDLTPRIDALVAAVDKLLKYQEEAAKGPRGFFAPVPDGRDQPDVESDILPRIERKYY